MSNIARSPKPVANSFPPVIRPHSPFPRVDSTGFTKKVTYKPVGPYRPCSGKLRNGNPCTFRARENGVCNLHKNGSHKQASPAKVVNTVSRGGRKAKTVPVKSEVVASKKSNKNIVVDVKVVETVKPEVVKGKKSKGKVVNEEVKVEVVESKPAAKSAAKTVAKPAAKSAAKTAAKPAAKSAAKPAAKSPSRPNSAAKSPSRPNSAASSDAVVIKTKTSVSKSKNVKSPSKSLKPKPKKIEAKPVVKSSPRKRLTSPVPSSPSRNVSTKKR